MRGLLGVPRPVRADADPGYRPEDDDAEALRKRITALHAPVQHMGQVWCGECSVRRSTGPQAEEWVALIPHPCPTIDVLDSKETTG
ncbi:hypothetical protein [Streptomyces microflavus]|uniref:hypothetical protein n=1 Tax=Streptomyces microflavus TaxID=1919 RepID=UPI003B212E43